MQETRFQSLIRGDPTCPAQPLSPCATTIAHVLQSAGAAAIAHVLQSPGAAAIAHVLQSPGAAAMEPPSATTEAHALVEPVPCNKRRHLSKKPVYPNSRVVPLTATTEKPSQEKRPSHSQK